MRAIEADQLAEFQENWSAVQCTHRDNIYLRDEPGGRAGSNKVRSGDDTASFVLNVYALLRAVII